MLPCTRCHKKNSQCAYPESRQKDVVSHHVADVPRGPSVQVPGRTERLRNHSWLSTSKMGGKAAMPFLYNYTHPRTKTISAYYKSAQTLGVRIFGDECAVASPRHLSDSAEGASPVDDVWLSGWTQEFENPFLFGNSEEHWWADIICAQNSHDHGVLWHQDHAQAITEQVGRDLAALHRSQCRKTRDRLSFDEEAFTHLFTTEKIVEFTGAYFSCWSPHCPILHRPTFDFTTVYPPLLLAVFLIGQAYSSELDASLGQAYYDIAEEYAFSHPRFNELLQDSLPFSPAPSTSLEPLQAAYLMVLVQMCSNKILARRRVRSSRYNDVIQAARGLQLFDTKNEFLDWEQRDIVDFDWHGFVEKESKIR